MRHEIVAGPATARRHAQLLASLGFASALDVTRAPAPLPLGDSLRVVAWNAQRGREPARAAELLRASGADVCLLSELDLGMARSGQTHAARALAGRLGYASAFGVEFLELGLGDADEQTRHAGQENSRGFHGGAILARADWVAPELLRLEPGGRWFDGRLGERRVGSRIAVLGKLPFGGRELALASVHLESHSDPDERAAQLAAVFDRLDEWAPGLPALVGGDVNTHSLSRAELENREALRAALARDPRRLSDPVPHEPLFALADARGYEWRAANLRPAATYKRGGRGALQLDWFFARGLAPSEPAVLPSDELSDHDAIALSVRLA
ncbi:MAG TPA: endonuclease/exonuclease/phosphatase family protein [Myxococcota bacterium]|nr:endonuclease/exonuclease/phosphatase family protein [Myxococcota bacterium]